MDRDAPRVHALTALITLLGALACILQIVAPFRGVWQLLVVQVLFVAAAITYARALRWRLDSSQHVKARLISRGNVLVLVSILTLVVLDTIAENRRPRGPAVDAAIGLLLGSALGAAAGLSLVFRRISTPPPPAGLTIADGLDDLLTLLRVFTHGKPESGEKIFTHAPSLDPRVHSWRFASALGLACGAALFLAHLQEGLPPRVSTGLLVAGIFVAAESVLTVLGYAVFGAYLGLRPRG